jgi:hypothetical protein
MRTFLRNIRLQVALAGAAAVLALGCGDVWATSIATDSYDSASGGTGWNGNWTLHSGASIAPVSTPLSYTARSVDDPGYAWTVNGGNSALRVTGPVASDPNLAYRSLDGAENGDVWIRFLFRCNPSAAAGSNEFLVYWFDNGTTTDHTLVPNIGIKTNTAEGGNEDVVVRLYYPGGDFAGSIPVDATSTHLVVGHLSKTSSAVAGRYNKFEMWVDPDAQNLVGDTNCSRFVYAVDNRNATALTSYSMLGMRAANLTPGADISIDELALGTQLVDVMSGVGGNAPVIPEPLTILGVLGAAAGIGGYLRARRTAK